jgi:hypothetical protein
VNKSVAMIPDDIFSTVFGAFAKLDPLLRVFIGAAAVGSVVFQQQIPKAGPGRAIMLALRSLIRSGPAFASMRNRDKGALLSKLNALRQDQFIVCRGPRGTGKTRMIREALTRTPGVVHLNISPGTTDEVIVNRAYAEISNTMVGAVLVNPEIGSRRVLWWYRLLFRRSPIVVIAATERTAADVQAGVRLAAVPDAARKLDSIGFRVIVDASENSISTRFNLREESLHLSPLPFEVLAVVDCRILSILADPLADPSHPHWHSRGLDSATDFESMFFVKSRSRITTIPNSRCCSNCCALWRSAMPTFVR